MWSFVWLVIFAACAVPAEEPPAPPTNPPDPPATRSTFHDCRGRAFDKAPIQSWRHDIATPLVTAAGEPNHAGRDRVVASSQGVSLGAKLAYGTIAKDLEDEDVRISIDDCTGWQVIGDVTTDGEGEVHTTLSRTLEVGAYDVMFQVLGDGSVTRSTIWVLPAGTHIVVTDIDGTLTASDSQLFSQILDGSYVPVAYPGAADLTAAHEARGQIVFYLTGRPDWLNDKTRTWLGDGSFAGGPLRIADSTGDIAPTQGGVGDFKKTVLADLRAGGYVIDTVYGNASTDIYAYLGAGIPATDVYIVGPHGGEQGTHAATDWTARAAEVGAMGTVTQPFDF